MVLRRRIRRAWDSGFWTDFESSNAVWVAAPDEEAALTAGRSHAEHWVRALFLDRGVDHRSSAWSASDFAHWIEHQPLEMFPGPGLDLLERIEA